MARSPSRGTRARQLRATRPASGRAKPPCGRCRCVVASDRSHAGFDFSDELLERRGRIGRVAHRPPDDQVVRSLVIAWPAVATRFWSSFFAAPGRPPGRIPARRSDSPGAAPCAASISCGEQTRPAIPARAAMRARARHLGDRLLDPLGAQIVLRQAGQHAVRAEQPRPRPAAASAARAGVSWPPEVCSVEQVALHARRGGDRARHRLGDVVELEVEEHLAAPRAHPAPPPAPPRRRTARAPLCERRAARRGASRSVRRAPPAIRDVERDNHPLARKRCAPEDLVRVIGLVISAPALDLPPRRS